MRERRLPLAKDLFAERGPFVVVTDRLPAIKPLLPSLRNPPQGLTLEAYLARLQSNARPQRQEQLTAVRYYLQAALLACENDWRLNILHDATNQLALLEQIEDWRYGRGETVWLVTFNYDTMLEAALQQYVEKPITSLEHYVAPGQPYKLVKLHGSIHWYREVDQGPSMEHLDQEDGARLLCKVASTLKVSQRYYCDPGGASALAYTRDGKQTLYPAIAIPVEGKQAFECPADHVAALEKALTEINRIIVIGWRAAEQRFLDLLGTHIGKPVRSLVVAQDRAGADEIGQRVRSCLPHGGDFVPAEGGFTTTLLAERFRAFLDETS